MKIIAKTVCISLMALFVLTLSDVQTAFASNTAYVKVAVLNVRSKPTTKSKIVGKVFLAEKINIKESTKKPVVISGIKDFWVRFDNGAKKGWLFKGFLSESPVLSAKEMAKKMTGTYYYTVKEYQDRLSKSPDPGNQYSYNGIHKILTIDGDKYTEKWFHYESGISDLFTGKIAYQSESIELIPLKRLSRASVYLYEPRNQDEESAYSSAYHYYSTDAYHLTNLTGKRASLSQGKKKYYFYIQDGKEYMVDFNPALKKKTLANNSWCYRKVEGN